LIFVAMGCIFAVVFENARERSGLVVGAVLYYLIYFVLFRAFHLGYSLSVVNREEFLTYFLFKGMLISGLAMVLASAWVAVVWRKTPTWPDAARLVAAFSAVIALSWMAQVLVLYYRNGITISTFMFDLTMAFTCYLDLLAMIGLPFGMLAGVLILGAFSERAGQ
jgi:hypothetical protein